MATGAQPHIDRKLMTAELRVSTRSEPRTLAGAVNKFQGEGFKVTLCAIGAGAVNQAMKAITVCRQMVSPEGDDLVVQPAFSSVVVDERTRTVLRLHVIRLKKQALFDLLGGA